MASRRKAEPPAAPKRIGTMRCPRGHLRPKSRKPCAFCADEDRLREEARQEEEFSAFLANIPPVYIMRDYSGRIVAKMVAPPNRRSRRRR